MFDKSSGKSFWTHVHYSSSFCFVLSVSVVCKRLRVFLLYALVVLYHLPRGLVSLSMD